MQDTDTAAAEAELARAADIVAAAAEKTRTRDRTLTRPHHFHATVFCFVSKDDHGNFVDSQHNEVLGMTPDACIRKAIARSERRQRNYHLAQLTECHDGSHSTREMED